MADSNLLDKLNKIKALAEQGVGGEKESAIALLDKLMKKYKVTIEELDEFSEVIESYDFWFHGEEEKTILKQIMYKVTNNPTYYELYHDRRLKTKIRKKCTASQKVEIDFLFEFYRALYRKEKERLLIAFIHKHELFGTSTDGLEPPERDDEEVLKIMMMKNALSDESPLLAIESGDTE